MKKENLGFMQAEFNVNSNSIRKKSKRKAFFGFTHTPLVNKNGVGFTHTPLVNKNGVGFTLIELLVVITIIGTLSGVVFTYLKGARASARDAMRQADLRQLLSAQGIYFGFNDTYYMHSAPEKNGVPAIGIYLSEMHDPQCPEGNCVQAATDYEWIPNNQNVNCNDPNIGALESGYWFCAFAVLEEESSNPARTIYFVASHRGTKKMELETKPSVIADCTCF